MKQKHFIDSNKGATILAVLGMMAYYNVWENQTAWLYLATHGLYGILWVTKSLTFPDRRWGCYLVGTQSLLGNSLVNLLPKH